VTDVAQLEPALEETLSTVEALIRDGLDLTTDEVHMLAQRAAMFDERFAYTERGRPRGAYVGGTARCVKLLALLIERGLPRVGELVRWAQHAPDVLEVLLATNPTQAEIDAGLAACCNWHSYDPNAEVIRRLLAANPSQAARDTALHDAALGTSRKVDAIDFEYFDVFEMLLEAGARPDHGTGTPHGTALHHFVSFALHNVAGDRQRAKRAARSDALLRKAVAAVATVDVVTDYGQTALHFACRNRSPERAKILVDAGADPQRADAQGLTPAKIADRDEALCAALGVPVPPAPVKKPRTVGPPPPKPTAADPFATGTRVSHAKFGEGHIVSSTGSGTSRKLGVKFGDGKTRVLAASFLTLLTP
jgi:hypothetical protein